jgi:hypothetical protein
MPDATGRFRAVIIDPDEGLRALFRTTHHAGLEITLHAPRWPSPASDAVEGYDVAIVGVDTPLGLQVLADLAGRPASVPVIGIAGQGFEGKSLEHILLLAEVRGAAATIMKPATVDEIAVAVWAVTLHSEANPPMQKRA